MKIGVSTLALYPKSLEEIFAYLDKLKVKYCEIINEYPYELIDNDLADSYDLKISIHSPISDINLASSNKAIRNSSVSQVKNSIEIASKMDSEIVVVHPGHIPILGHKFEKKIIENNLNSLKECSDHANEFGIKMCIENMPDFDGLLCKDLNELEKLVKAVDAHITLDVGHAHNMGVPIEDMLRYKRIKHIHISDNDGSDDNHNSVGSDGINFEMLFSKLKDIKYRDILVIEVKYSNEILESLDYIKKLKINLK